MVYSSSDLLSLIKRDPVLRSISRISIVNNRPALDAGVGLNIYIQRYPIVGELVASWVIWIINYDDDPLDVVLSQLRKILPQFRVVKNGPIIEATVTELLSEKTDTVKEKRQKVANDKVYSLIKNEINKLSVELNESISDRMLLVRSGKDGRDGNPGLPGKDGQDGRDGKDIDATNTSLFQLKDVYEGIDLNKGQVLTWDGLGWTNLYVPQLLSSINSTGNGGGSANSLQLDITNTEDPVLGQILWEQDEHTAVLGIDGNVHNHLGHDIYAWCRNDTGTTIDKGTAVMFAGTIGASGRLKIAPMVADGSYPGYVFLGFAAEDIPHDTDGNVISYGKLKGLDTSLLPEQSILWCDPLVPGGLTATEPAAPNLKLPVAAVISSANNGTLMVRWDTGRRIKDLHDVEANSPSDGQALAWNSTNGRWEPKTITGTGGVEEAPLDGNFYVRQNSAWVDLQAALDALAVRVIDGGNFTTGLSDGYDSIIDGGTFS